MVLRKVFRSFCHPCGFRKKNRVASENRSVPRLWEKDERDVDIFVTRKAQGEKNSGCSDWLELEDNLPGRVPGVGRRDSVGGGSGNFRNCCDREHLGSGYSSDSTGSRHSSWWDISSYDDEHPDNCTCRTCIWCPFASVTVVDSISSNSRQSGENGFGAGCCDLSFMSGKRPISGCLIMKRKCLDVSDYIFAKKRKYGFLETSF